MSRIRTTQNAAAYMALKIVGSGVGFLNAIMFARILGAKDYGAMALALAFSTLAGTLAAFGLMLFVTREVSVLYAGKSIRGLVRLISDARSFCVGSSGVIIAAILVGFYFLPAREQTGSLSFVTPSLVALAALFILCFSQNQVRSGSLRGLNRIILADSPELIVRPVVIFSVIVIALLLHVQLGATGGFGVQVLAVVVAFVIGSWMLRRVFKEQRLRATAGDSGRVGPGPWGLLTGSRHLLFISVIAIVDGQISLYLVGTFLGTAGAGLYQAAIQPVNIIAMGVAAAGISIQSGVAASWAGNRKAESQDFIFRAVKFSTIVAVVAGFALLIGANLIAGLYGQNFAAAGTLIRILTFGQIAHGVTGPVGAVLTMTGHQRQAFYIDLLFLAVRIGSVIAGIHYLGIIGAALAEVACRFTMRLTEVIYMYHKTGLITIMWRRHYGV